MTDFHANANANAGISPPGVTDPEPARRHFRLRRRASHMQPPLTPMIDIVFQLLLFFLLTMQFRQAEGVLPANLPAAPSTVTAVTPLEALRVELYSQANLASQSGQTESEILIKMPELNFQTGNWGEFRAMLRKLGRELDAAETPVLIIPAANVDWQQSLNAFNQAKMAGMEQINFQKPQDIDMERH